MTYDPVDLKIGQAWHNHTSSFSDCSQTSKSEIQSRRRIQRAVADFKLEWGQVAWDVGDILKLRTLLADS